MLSKAIPLVVYPLGFTILGIVAALILSLFQSHRGARSLLGVIVVLIWLASMPVVANSLSTWLEAQYPAASIDELPRADVVIVLGGIIGQPLPPRAAADLGDPIDRVIHAARLFRGGKVDWILVTGGNQDWQAAVRPEGELIAELLEEFGVPRTAIVVEAAARNTFENASNSQPILESRGVRTALLVTSGTHMPRAMATFRKAGIDVIPAATDIRVRYPLFEGVLDFLPDAGALARTSDALKEILGGAVYRWRGWA